MAQLGTHRYHLVYSTYESKDYYQFYECSMADQQCQSIKELEGIYYGFYGTQPELIVDHHTQEIHAFIGGRLIFTYGPLVKKYQLQAMAVLGKYDFWIAQYGDENNPSFLLYRCTDPAEADSEYSSQILPFHYTPAHPKSIMKIELAANKLSQEVQVLFDEQLIYTYGNTPHCYVPGCVASYQATPDTKP